MKSRFRKLTNISLVSLIFALAIYSNVIAQTSSNKFKGDRVILSQTIFDESVKFYVYKEPLKIFSSYKDTTEAKNQYPEELMISIMSANSQVWENYNYISGKAPQKDQAHFNAVKGMNKQKNYMELHNKYELTHNGLPTAIIKFYLYLENKKPITGSVTMQKVNGRWYKTSIAALQEIAIMLMRFQSDKLQQVFEGKETENAIMNEVIKKVSNNGGIDLDKLMKEYDSWYGEIRDQERINYFIDKNSW